MEYNITYLFIIIIPFISFILYIIPNGLFLISTITSIYFIVLYIYISNTIDRKETLNIVRSGEVLYFNLSDDLLLSVELTEQKTLSETITDIVLSEMATLKDMVNGVNFINFKDERLQQRLNALIEKR